MKEKQETSSLESAREEINSIDRDMADLFCRRMNAVKLVAEYKKQHGLPILDTARENEVILKNSALIDNPELRGYYISFLKNNMEISKQLQNRLQNGMTVAYSGVPGAFSNIAAELIFPDAATIPFSDFSSAYAASVNGQSDCTVLPIENSYNGDVSQVIDHAFTGPLYISGIYELEISHCLLANPGVKESNIKTVISHPQALGQCAEYIRSHGFKTIEAVNTAVAAKNIADSGSEDIAAIASFQTAKLYGLNILDKNINESSLNTTRFAVFTTSFNAPDPKESGDEHFVLFFTVNNSIGSLGDAVKLFGDNGFNLSALKSRPTKLNNWEYYFFVEGDGNICSERGNKLLSELQNICVSVKLAGCFKRSVRLKQ